MGDILHSTAEIRLESAKSVVFFIICMPMGGGAIAPHRPPGCDNAL